ncbi:hypothetical protein MKW92_024612, partial [Papaver armeniacum]
MKKSFLMRIRKVIIKKKRGARHQMGWIVHEYELELARTNLEERLLQINHDEQ